jgi:predicted RNA-binding protein associated with RNAse of E/G family
MWSRGDTVVLRELWDGRIWKARAWTVVEDEPDELVLWIQSGAETRIPDTEEAVPPEEWELVPSTFRRRALRITRPGAYHSRLLFFGDAGALEGWYVNFERPLERSRLGFDYVDLLLDLWISPDGKHRLVDENELEHAVAQGRIATGEADAVRAEAERVLAEHEFPTGWEDFRPDPAWRPPRLPDGWDEIGEPERR